MQFKGALVLAFVGYATAECYGSGLDYTDKNVVLTAASSACGTSFNGTYGPQSTFDAQRGRCINLDSETKVDLIITHISEGDRDLEWAECYDGLQKEINGCPAGGHSKYDNWEYKVDPNYGQC